MKNERVVFRFLFVVGEKSGKNDVLKEKSEKWIRDVINLLQFLIKNIHHIFIQIGVFLFKLMRTTEKVFTHNS